MHLLLGPPGEGALTAPGDILLLGFGNALCGDDGVGPAVVARLHALGLPPGLRAEEGGQDALCIGRLWAGEQEVWLVDAVQRGAPPGTVHRLGHEELLAVPQRHLTAHRLSLPECLRWLAQDGGLGAVRYRLWGIEPGRLAPIDALSPEAGAAVEALVREVRDTAVSRREGLVPPW